MEHDDPLTGEAVAPLGVGILGANPDRGWALRAHVPALRATAGLRLLAVGTTRRESAEAARARFGARYAFTDTTTLVEHPDVDLVVVTVKVAAHWDLVRAALGAGKHVYCEWPLALDARQAEQLAALADAAGVHAIVGLQARYDPAVAAARELLSAGRLGTITAASVRSSRSKGNTDQVPAWSAYTYDIAQGAGLVDVLGGHALDLAGYLLGSLRDVHVRTATHRREHTTLETGEPIAVSTPDHLHLTGLNDSDAIVSIDVHDGDPVVPDTRIDIVGTEGKLSLASPPGPDSLAAQLQMTPLSLHRADRGHDSWTPVHLQADHASRLQTEAANVARVYAQLVRDIRDGTRVCCRSG